VSFISRSNLADFKLLGISADFILGAAIISMAFNKETRT